MTLTRPADIAGPPPCGRLRSSERVAREAGSSPVEVGPYLVARAVRLKRWIGQPHGPFEILSSQMCSPGACAAGQCACCPGADESQ